MRTILRKEIKRERCNAAALGAFNASVGNSEPEQVYEVSVKDIFNDIQGINPNTSTVSSIGSFVTEQSQQVADKIHRNIMAQLPKDSIAYKIMFDSRSNKYSEKQMWAISYELAKNKKYSQNLGRENHLRRQKATQKINESKSKLSANKSGSQNILDSIKASGRKLGDYYKWLNTSGNPFRKEKFNKKYTIASANAFLNK